MRSRSLVALAGLFAVTLWCGRLVEAAGPLLRKPLGVNERNELLTLLKAVDLAEETDVTSEVVFQWDSQALKAGNETAYVPFTLALQGLPDGFKSAVMYVRAVSRHDGLRASGERSAIVDWLAHGTPPPAHSQETVFVGPGEMPVGGPATSSPRRSTSAPAESSALLALQQKAYEKQKTAAEEAKKKAETKQRDPFLFPFEDYAFFELKPARGGEPRKLERALALPPGDYDVYIALLDRARAKTSSPTVVKQEVTVPDYWSDRLSVSPLMLVTAMRTLKAPLPVADQREHPYTFGLTEMTPRLGRSLAPDDPLSVVLQICNYGAPDSDLVVEYNFYHYINGTRMLFNRTEPQRFGDSDLPPAGGWESQTFAMQSVSLQTFLPGPYELEVTVRDRLTRGTATRTVAFTVAGRGR